MKRLWEQKGIKFPGKGILPNSSVKSCTATSTRTASVTSVSDVPNTVEEENLYLEMGITESLKSYPSTPKNAEQSEVTSRDRQPDVDEPDYGLSPGGGGTPLFGLYGDVPLDRVWFFGLAVLNRVYNLTCLCHKRVKNLS